MLGMKTRKRERGGEEFFISEFYSSLSSLKEFKNHPPYPILSWIPIMSFPPSPTHTLYAWEKNKKIEKNKNKNGLWKNNLVLIGFTNFH